MRASCRSNHACILAPRVTVRNRTAGLSGHRRCIQRFTYHPGSMKTTAMNGLTSATQNASTEAA